MEKIFETINEAIYTDFDTEVSAPLDGGMGWLADKRNNFFRNGPLRKVFSIESDAFSDEECSEDEWYEREQDCEDVFKEVLPIAEKIWGKGKVADDFFYNNAIFYDWEDESKLGQYFDDIEWSPEYECGATLDGDTEEIVYWIINNRFVVLQRTLSYSDGRVEANVLVTITPFAAQV